MDLPFNHVPYAVTISDLKGQIIYMNDRSIATFSSDGQTLVGRNLSEFHGQRAMEMIKRMVAEGSSNSYTIHKGGVRKIIHQAPWFDNQGAVAGLIELAIPIPLDMPHYERK